ncbi:MAG: hypothetical protein IPP42_11605 [Saprospiraceae bacterium]|nr:hypothetical protein [Saprospiraceae bacterium]
MLEYFSIKYPNSNPVMSLKALGYFDDIDPDMDPPKMIVKLSLNKIKKRIIDALQHKDKIFS